MSRLERRLQGVWAGEPAPVWLRWSGPVLERLWRLGASARGAAYRSGLFKQAVAPRPVISVGNLSVGGTGKTPLVAWVASKLLDEGHRPAVLMRGYGGDEQALYAHWTPELNVVVDPDRVAGARKAVAGGASVLLLDDGFQHRRLRRDLDVVLVSAEQPLPERTLPLGPYRESAGALARADVIVLTVKSAGEGDVDRWRDWLRTRLGPDQTMTEVHFETSAWRDLAGNPVDVPGDDVLAVCGIGQPQTFSGLVGAATGGAVDLMAFRDHHDFDGADVERILRAAGPRTVVVTEKDAVKLRRLKGLPEDLRVLSLVPRWTVGEAELLERVRTVVGDPT